MEIYIDWEYFFGIIGVLILIAWYSNGRFTALEVSTQWLKDTLNEMKDSVDELKTASDNKTNPAFGSSSPVNLKSLGKRWLTESGWDVYIEEHKEEIMKMCEGVKDSNPYEVQNHIFKLFDDLVLKDDFEDTLKQFAFDEGTTMNVLRRVGAIHFRNLCLGQFGMREDDIDKHDPDQIN